MYTFLGGLSGVGKTTTILCLSRILLGASWKDAVLELNASNERGIDVVRNRIKMFAQQKVSIEFVTRHTCTLLKGTAWISFFALFFHNSNSNQPPKSVSHFFLHSIRLGHSSKRQAQNSHPRRSRFHDRKRSTSTQVSFTQLHIVTCQLSHMHIYQAFT